MYSLSKITLSFLIIAGLAAPAEILAQTSPPAVGSWDIKYVVEDIGFTVEGSLTIADNEKGLSGIIHFDDIDNSSPAYKLNDLVFENDRLTFVINEGAFAPMKADVQISGDSLEGEMSLEIDFYDNYKGSGSFQGTRQNEGGTSAIIDHAAVIRNLNEKTLNEGQKFYNQVCAACHGADGTSSLPTARSFNADEFKYGSDPYSIWKTITDGAGQMGAQRWLSPEQRYSVVQYIRQELVQDENPQAYFEITDEYLSELPKPSKNAADLEQQIKEQALEGSQEYGQLYFSDHLGDYGKALYSQLGGHASSALTVELADSVRLSYNVQRMSTSAVWKGSFDLSKTKYQLYRGEEEPAIDGDTLAGLDRMRWSYQNRYRQLDVLVSSRTPFPERWLDYHGHYRHGDKVILSYSIMGRKMLEMPSAQLLKGTPVIQQTLKIAPGDSWRRLELAGLGDEETESALEGVFALDSMDVEQGGLDEENWDHPEQSLIMTAPGEGGSVEAFVAAGVQGDTQGMRWEIGEGHQLGLYIPPSKKAQTIRIHRISGEGPSQLKAFAGYLSEMQSGQIPDLSEFLKGGERQWNETVVSEGALGVGRPHYDPVHYGKENQNAPENLVSIPENYPYVVDRIGLPFDNPWNSWIRPSGLDFFEDGRLVMSTYVGDVWVAEGVDEDLDEIRWQRIAAGLYDPFGVKIVDGKIYVVCRDRIVRLEDLNEDGETDFYRSYFADSDVSDVPVQAFNYGLQTDSEGNFLYAKGGQYTNDDEPGHVIQVSPDGKTQQSLAIGFRAPNGVTVAPDDRIFSSDNQGNWGPANKINLIKKGGFYGYIPTVNYGETDPGPKEYQMRADLGAANYPEEVLPDTFDQPMIWLPQEFDNSPGGGAWTPKEWGPLGDRLLWTSFGKGWVYYVLMQEVDGVTQAAVSALPFQFDSGTQRARINPADGQYYIAGITGWDDSFAAKYGSIDRIRYTGGEGVFMDRVKVRPEGIEITFNQKLNKKIAVTPDQYQIEQWNYRWMEQYGSAHWSAKNPEQEGQDEVPVQEATLSNDGKTVLLKVSPMDLGPVNQMRIQLDLETEEGEPYKDTMYLTINKMPKKK